LLRHIARGGDLDSSIATVMISTPVTVREGLSDARVLEDVRTQFRGRTAGRKELTQYVPVLNDDGVVLDVLDMYEILARSPRQGDRVTVYGLGFVGLTVAAALAARGHTVTGIDANEAVISSLNSGKPHVHEPRLPEMIRQGLASGRLVFRNEAFEEENPVVIIAVGTPVDHSGKASLAAVEAVCHVVGSKLRRGALVMLRSTVPVGTTRTMVMPILEQLSGLSVGKALNIAFAPERTVQGQAIKELSSLPQVVGGATESCTEKASGFWNTLTDTIVRVDSLEAAELVKLVNNSFRDLSFAFSNGLAFLADRYNIDAARLIGAANESYPRDRVPRPSPGVGGYCLTKDPFLYAAAEGGLGHAELARIGRNINTNASRYPIFVLERYAARIQKDLANLNVLLVGMAFKGYPETNDMRGSPAVDVAQELMRRGCAVICHDRVIPGKDLEPIGLKFCELQQGAKQADAILIMNNHPQNIPTGLLENIGIRPVLLFDGWSLLERHEVEKYPGVTYATLGYMTPNVNTQG
jgi:UDP-N-acetyl-D-mannosaminuronic acid dehydrogenase